jgi:hypothetical protein
MYNQVVFYMTIKISLVVRTIYEMVRDNIQFWITRAIFRLLDF